MIFIDNRQTTIEFNKDYESIMEDIIDYSLKNEGIELDYEISIILINNEEIQNLNREFRNIDKETDVLSFPMLEYENNKIYKDMYIGFSFTEEYMDEGRLVLGDIALSLEKAKAQSIEYGHSFIREVCYLVVHSTLHLLGYDHMNEEEKAVMRKREEDILSAFNLMREL